MHSKLGVPYKIILLSKFQSSQGLVFIQLFQRRPRCDTDEPQKHQKLRPVTDAAQNRRGSL